MRLALLLHIGLLMSWSQTDFEGDEIRIYRGERQTFDILSDLWHEMLHKVGMTLSIPALNADEETVNRLAYAIVTILSDNKWAADLLCHAGMTGLSPSRRKCKSCLRQKAPPLEGDGGVTSRLAKVYRNSR